MFADQGYEFAGIDHVGFGKSGGKFGKLSEPQEMIGNINNFIEKYV